MNTKKVVMAVDPLENEFKPNKSSLIELRTWLKKNSVDLELVHVMTASTPSDNLLQEFIDREQLVKRYADELGFVGEVRTKVLLQPSSSNRKAAKTLLGYADRTSAALIVLTTSGRKLLGRLVLGSFADSIVAEAVVPVLFLSSDRQLYSWTNTALFPTDFSPASRQAFDLFLRQFKSTTPDVILFHMSTLPYDWYSSFAMPPLPGDYWEELFISANREAARWVEYARAQGFSAKAMIDSESTDIPTAIQKAASKEKVGLIAMASTTGGVRSRVLGSIASEVFYLQKFPVWVCGPEALKMEVAMAKTPAFPVLSK